MLKPVHPLQLYAYLLRKTRELPPHVQNYYRHHIRQQFNSHLDEEDPKRISEIINKAVDDMEWLIQKVGFSSKPVIFQYTK
ncbi:hypothetical protein PHET_07607 [Paragonimus heterotremus]|uniref:LYR motif-containing protein 9 n=1 Tax=Paragonimus heterotremus TaxID=100268 RepID=A0A8J4WPN3_9TREM|nr:hypothetical protein PHET_07607 [Paragonimus heterotremus]